MGFSKEEYWSGLLFTLPGDLPNPGIEPMSLVSWIGRWILYRHLGSPKTTFREGEKTLVDVLCLIAHV